MKTSYSLCLCVLILAWARPIAPKHLLVKPSGNAAGAKGDLRFATQPVSLQQWQSKCSDTGLDWLAAYAKWHQANRHAEGARFLVHACVTGICGGIGESRHPASIMPC